MRVAVLKEDPAVEPRTAATPETVRKLAALGATIAVQSGAGAAAGLSDERYREAGAEIAGTAETALQDADLVLKVTRPESLPATSGAAIVALMDPFGNEAELRRIAEAGLQAFSLELIPRITRAQVMDVLSSQANLAGYQAVIEAASHFGRAMPMMMTAAGTVPAARVFVMGAGVAGLQAVATARRLGAVVTATDVRPAAKEQVASLGAKFIAVEDEEFKRAETEGGYAREMSKEYQAKQAALAREHIAKQDIVITTAYPRPPGAEARQCRDGGLDGGRLGAGRSCGGTWRQRRGRSAGRGREGRRRHDHRLPEHGRTHRCVLLGAACP
jgi:NAD(P) transhydrogenase subunit alpha